MASEFDTKAELEADVRERLGRGKRLEQAAEARDAVLEVLLDKVEVPLPERLLQDELTARREQFEQQLAWSGMTLQKYLDEQKQTVDEYESELETRTRESLAAQFILDAIAKKREFGVDQQELSAHIVRRAQQAGQDPSEAIAHIQEHPHHINEYVAEIVRGKALAEIVESAKVTDKSGNEVVLKGLQADGTFADPEDASDAAEETEPAAE